MATVVYGSGAYGDVVGRLPKHRGAGRFYRFGGFCPGDGDGNADALADADRYGYFHTHSDAYAYADLHAHADPHALDVPGEKRTHDCE